MALSDKGTPIGDTSFSWWTVFCGEGRDTDISLVMNSLRALLIESSQLSIAAATNAFISSIKDGGSAFNDPDSFLWSQLEDVLGDSNE